MSVHIEVVLGIQTCSCLDDAETLVTGIEGHISTVSEFRTCETEIWVFNMIKKSLKSSAVAHSFYCKQISRNKIQMGAVNLIIVLDEHSGFFRKEKNRLFHTK